MVRISKDQSSWRGFGMGLDEDFGEGVLFKEVGEERKVLQFGKVGE